MFGMAQVIGAKTLGINLLAERDTGWPAPEIGHLHQEVIDSWSLDSSPHWTDIPLAIAYQAAGEHLPATDDGSKVRKGNHQQRVSRLRLVLVRAVQWEVLGRHTDTIFAAIWHENPHVPLQRIDRRKWHDGVPLHHAIAWGYAQDQSKKPWFAVVPISKDDFILVRLSDNKEYVLNDFSDTPLPPLPGMYFFDAWPIASSMA